MSKCLICNISKEIMNQSNINYSYLKDEDLAIQVKDLVLETNLNENYISFKYPFVYMFDYEEDEMNQISNFFKQHQIFPIYCASTPSNLLWTLKELLDELVKEHMMFSTMKTLQDLIKKTVCLPIDENKEIVEKTLMEAFVVLQEKEFDRMNEMIIKLQEFHRGK